MNLVNLKEKQFYIKYQNEIMPVASIDWNNKVVDSYGITEPIYNIPFEECEFFED